MIVSPIAFADPSRASNAEPRFVELDARSLDGVAEMDESRCGRRVAVFARAGRERLQLDVQGGGLEVHAVGGGGLVVVSGLSCATIAVTAVEPAANGLLVDEWTVPVRWPGAITLKSGGGGVLLVGGSSGSATGSVCVLRHRSAVECVAATSFFPLTNMAFAVLNPDDEEHVRADLVSFRDPRHPIATFALPACVTSVAEAPNESLVFGGCAEPIPRAIVSGEEKSKSEHKSRLRHAANGHEEMEPLAELLPEEDARGQAWRGAWGNHSARVAARGDEATDCAQTVTVEVCTPPAECTRTELREPEERDVCGLSMLEPPRVVRIGDREVMSLVYERADQRPGPVIEKVVMVSGRDRLSLRAFGRLRTKSGFLERVRSKRFELIRTGRVPDAWLPFARSTLEAAQRKRDRTRLASPPSTRALRWTDPVVRETLKREPSFAASSLSSLAATSWIGDPKAEMLTCRGWVPAQVCVIDPCDVGDFACEASCHRACGQCDRACGATCAECVARCSKDDAACDAACIDRCVGCHVECVSASDRCVSGTCVEARKRCERETPKEQRFR